jgi:hypothetical protein
MQAIAEVNKKLQSNVFRRVMGTEVVSELEPASDYYSRGVPSAIFGKGWQIQ